MTVYCLTIYDSSPATFERSESTGTFWEHSDIQPAIPWRPATRNRLTPFLDCPAFRAQVGAVSKARSEDGPEFNFGREKTPICQIHHRLSVFPVKTTHRGMPMRIQWALYR